jgi:D-alanyl-D-alanine carboxypeptidase (penicillin-binding protein 5/6)
MENTQFTNPIGLDGANYSTASDLYKLAKKVLQTEVLADIVKTQTYTLTSTDAKFTHTVYTTNKLLVEVPESIGIKTGTTVQAGEVLAYAYKKDDINLLIIVMRSNDRFADTKALLTWTLESFVFRAR